MNLTSPTKPAQVLLIEDNEADQVLVKRALSQNFFASELSITSDGEEALDYMYKKGIYKDSVLPDIILLDLNLPKVSGIEFLKIIKMDPDLGYIPIVIMTTSGTSYDINRVYKAGGNSYIIKPVQFDEFKKTLTQIGNYWLQLAKLP